MWDPFCAQAHHDLGIALAQRGDDDGALEMFRDAAKCNPAMHAAYYHIGMILEARADTDGATAAYKQSLKITGPHGPAKTRLQTMHLGPCCQEIVLRLRRREKRTRDN